MEETLSQFMYKTGTNLLGASSIENRSNRNIIMRKRFGRRSGLMIEGSMNPVLYRSTVGATLRTAPNGVAQAQNSEKLEKLALNAGLALSATCGSEKLHSGQLFSIMVNCVVVAKLKFVILCEDSKEVLIICEAFRGGVHLLWVSGDLSFISCGNKRAIGVRKERKKRKTTYQKEVRSDGDSQTGIVYIYGSIGDRIRDERSRNGGHSSTKNRRTSWKFESRKLGYWKKNNDFQACSCFPLSLRRHWTSRKEPWSKKMEEEDGA
ncbi:hypothetical protein V8G54_002417 [Vigna mungo]|uniref:Uncharacterized protein n=1 Tax=Vigna mungo TaxID=3915 RepID=A0AAQ3PC69_VIGMU